MKVYEVNFDGIAGPTHNYSGLSQGNVASLANQGNVSNPKEAALQGLRKMKFMHDLGVKQAVFPPHERPHIPTLKALGFTGSDEAILAKAAHEAHVLLANCTSAACMWAANAATIAPSADTADGRVHITPANLAENFHRAIEAPAASKILRAIFQDSKYFAHHSPLPIGGPLGDEGAANHTRLCTDYGKAGIHLFSYGRLALGEAKLAPKRFPARQTFEASQSIARLHQIPMDRCFFAQQHPDAIDAGVFHQDVASVGNQNLFLTHEKAFVHQERVLDELHRHFEKFCSNTLKIINVKEKEVPLKEAVKTYLFNSQLVALPGGSMALIAPIECEESPIVKPFLDSLLNSSSPIRAIHYLNLRQSMANGGGPACLRLRIVMTQDEIAHAHHGVFLTDHLYTQLVAWVEKYYRDHLSADDLVDVRLLHESREALDALTKILGLGAIYSFQE